MRTNYKNTIENAFEAFGTDNVYVGILENLFDKNEIERMSNFLGVPADVNFSKVRVNETKGKPTDTKIDAIVKDYYSDVYEFCHNHFPITKELW